MQRTLLGWSLVGMLAGCGPKPGVSSEAGASSPSSSSSTGSSGSSATTEAPPTTTGAPNPTSTGEAESTSTSGAGTPFITPPDLGPEGPCECAADELCMYEMGIDSWWKICVVPPEGCDPAMYCSQACAQACINPPLLPAGCDEAEPPMALTCRDGASECSAWAQNCPDGEKCARAPQWSNWIWDLECVPLAETPPGVGEPCVGKEASPTGADDCAKGALCLPVGEMGASRCVASCGGTPQAPICPPGQVCGTTDGGTVTACVPACDPLVQDCPSGQVCTLGLDGFACMPDDSGADGQLFDGCLHGDECDPGLHCVENPWEPKCEFRPCCVPYCDLLAPGCEAPGASCVSLFTVLEAEAPLPAWEHVGVCVALR